MKKWDHCDCSTSEEILKFLSTTNLGIILRPNSPQEGTPSEVFLRDGVERQSSRVDLPVYARFQLG